MTYGKLRTSLPRIQISTTTRMMAADTPSAYSPTASRWRAEGRREGGRRWPGRRRPNTAPVKAPEQQVEGCVEVQQHDADLQCLGREGLKKTFWTLHELLRGFGIPTIMPRFAPQLFPHAASMSTPRLRRTLVGEPGGLEDLGEPEHPAGGGWVPAKAVGRVKGMMLTVGAALAPEILEQPGELLGCARASR